MKKQCDFKIKTEYCKVFFIHFIFIKALKYKHIYKMICFNFI